MAILWINPQLMIKIMCEAKVIQTLAQSDSLFTSHWQFQEDRKQSGGRQKLERQNSWQLAKHASYVSSYSRLKEGSFGNGGFSTKDSFVSAATLPSCNGEEERKESGVCVLGGGGGGGQTETHRQTETGRDRQRDRQADRELSCLGLKHGLPWSAQWKALIWKKQKAKTLQWQSEGSAVSTPLRWISKNVL